ncbi:DUF2975 domain-containing protein [Nonomuraea sp. NPDC050547]|uniref:DUF2975 domain-containing protein n=1 Tax=Nonomuraea sp. NPDC050547 TaxID=3364368 RepID=UPI00378D56EF
MATAQPSVLGRARRPAIFALLVAATGAITGMVLYSQAGLFGLGSRLAVARSPHGFGISLDGHPAFTQGALPGVHVSAGSVEFFTGSPGTVQYIWQALTTVPTFLVTAVAFFLVWRLLWRARQGVYLPRVVGQVRLLGWCLLIGGLLAPQLEHFAMMRLLDTLARNESFYGPANASLAVPLLGLGLLAVASVLRDGVRMRDDLEGTV